jgi:flagellar biosynthetic protein FliR
MSVPELVCPAGNLPSLKTAVDNGADWVYMDTTTELYGLLNAFFWPFVRLLALFSSAPILGDQSVPVRVKVALAIAGAFLVAPGLIGAPGSAPFSGDGLMLLIQQVLVGVAIGLGMRFVFAAVELAGDMIGMQMGISMATFIDPQNSDQAPIVGSFLAIIASLVLLAINGHLLMISALVDSFRTIPISAQPELWLNLERFVALGGDIFRIGLHLSLPVLATLLVLNLAMGVLTRAAPQLNIFAVGFPITILAGLFLLGVSLPYIGANLEQALLASLSAIMPAGHQ